MSCEARSAERALQLSLEKKVLGVKEITIGVQKTTIGESKTISPERKKKTNNHMTRMPRIIKIIA